MYISFFYIFTYFANFDKIETVSASKFLALSYKNTNAYNKWSLPVLSLLTLINNLI